LRPVRVGNLCREIAWNARNGTRPGIGRGERCGICRTGHRVPSRERKLQRQDCRDDAQHRAENPNDQQRPGPALAPHYSPPASAQLRAFSVTPSRAPNGTRGRALSVTHKMSPALD